MKSKWRSFFVVSLANAISRITGLIRDALSFGFLGASELNSAFICAFTLPNLFRRLLGEGALTSALVPILSTELEKDGREKAFFFFNSLLNFLILVLLGINFLGTLVFGVLKYGFNLNEARYLYAINFSLILFPYVMLICLSAIFCAVLNVFQSFSAAAFSSLCLNLCMIFSLLFFGLIHQPITVQAYALCVAVLLGGFVQLVGLFGKLYSLGWRYAFTLHLSPQLKQLLGLFIPAVYGAAIYQINILMVRLLAFSLDDSAVSLLYLANRLMEVPLGIFVIAIATVFFPEMSRLVAKEQHGEFFSAYRQGLLSLLALTLPSTLGIAWLCPHIFKAFFQWGAFGAEEAQTMRPLILICALQLPLQALNIFFTKVFHSFKDTRTPVKAGTCSFLINLLLGLTLMRFGGIFGLGFACTLSALFYCIYLGLALVRKHACPRFWLLRSSVLKVLLATLLMGIGGQITLEGLLKINPSFSSGIILAIVIPSCVVLYVICLLLLKFEPILWQHLKHFVFKKKHTK